MTTAPFDIREFLLVAGAVLLGLTLHEAAHAYVAFRLGDDTGFKSGRLTFNPIKHVHPVGTVLLPLALIAIQAPFVIGWAKPVPIRASKLANPNRDMAFVAAAGPLANFVMAAVFRVIAFALQKHGTPTNNWLVQAVRICA